MKVIAKNPAQLSIVTTGADVRTNPQQNNTRTAMSNLDPKAATNAIKDNILPAVAVVGGSVAAKQLSRYATGMLGAPSDTLKGLLSVGVPLVGTALTVLLGGGNKFAVNAAVGMAAVAVESAIRFAIPSVADSYLSDAPTPYYSYQQPLPYPGPEMASNYLAEAPVTRQRRPLNAGVLQEANY